MLKHGSCNFPPGINLAFNVDLKVLLTSCCLAEINTNISLGAAYSIDSYYRLSVICVRLKILMLSGDIPGNIHNFIARGPARQLS
jgi:hypothetical protein